MWVLTVNKRKSTLRFCTFSRTIFRIFPISTFITSFAFPRKHSRGLCYAPFPLFPCHLHKKRTWQHWGFPRLQNRPQFKNFYQRGNSNVPVIDDSESITPGIFHHWLHKYGMQKKKKYTKVGVFFILFNLIPFFTPWFREKKCWKMAKIETSLSNFFLWDDCFL